MKNGLIILAITAFGGLVPALAQSHRPQVGRYNCESSRSGATTLDSFRIHLLSGAEIVIASENGSANFRKLTSNRQIHVPFGSRSGRILSGPGKNARLVKVDVFFPLADSDAFRVQATFQNSGDSLTRWTRVYSCGKGSSL